MSTPSTVVADRYRLVQLLGAGGMGVVWQAWDERLERAVALKMLRTQPELNEHDLELTTQRAMREARISAGLHHPHAVTVYDVVEHEGRPCIVMQLVVSTTLSELLGENGTLAPPEVARIGAQVASALAAAHKLRIVHRDVKPGNILITEDGSALISDFGISYALGDATITATGLIHGTPAYLAPEVARGKSSSFASDVFSLGATMYTALEGEPPFGSDKNAIALLHRVARGGVAPAKHAGMLRPLLDRMLNADPKRRPRMPEVAAELSRLAEWRADGVVGAGAVAGEGVDASGQTTEEMPEPGAEGDPEGVDESPDAPDVATAMLGGGAAAAVGESAPDVRAVSDLTTEAMPRDAAAGAAATAVTRPAPREATPTELDWPFGAVSTSEVTEPLTKPAPPPRPPVTSGSDEPRRSRRMAVVVGAALAIAAVVAALFLIVPLVAEGPSSADPAPSSSARSSPSSEASTPAESAPTEPSESANEAPPPQPTTEPAPQAPTAEERVVQTIADYYATVGSDRDSAWNYMTADYQENHAGGRANYESFWNNISGVQASDVTATGPDTGQATLTYTFTDGSVVQEVTSFRFVDEGGTLKIAASEVLSSTDL